jgi:hypothetical protein
VLKLSARFGLTPTDEYDLFKSQQIAAASTRACSAIDPPRRRRRSLTGDRAARWSAALKADGFASPPSAVKLMARKEGEAAATAGRLGGKPFGELPDWLARPIEDDPTYEWAVTAWRRAEAAPDSWFDAAKATRWSRCGRGVQPDRRPLRRQAVPACKWQEIIVRLLVGWKVPVEVIDPRLGSPPSMSMGPAVPGLALWIPRKNGKSEFLAALALLFWALEGVVGGQGYVFARDEDQARLPFNKMKAMVGYNADLPTTSRRTRIRCISSPRGGVRAADRRRGRQARQGSRRHHRRRDARVAQPQGRERSTAGHRHAGSSRSSFMPRPPASRRTRQASSCGMKAWRSSRAGDDPTTLVVLFAADEEDDWEDEEVWARANPSLGLSPTLPFLRREAAIAKGNPRKTATFKCYHLNQWVESTERWLPIKQWDACAPNKKGGRPSDGWLAADAFAAFDVSATRDITAKVLVFPPRAKARGGRWPAASGCRRKRWPTRIRQNPRVPFAKWVDEGALSTTPGDFVDQGYVLGAIMEDGESYDLQDIGYDPWNTAKLIADLQAEGVDAERLIQIRQGIMSMGEPSKHFERLVFAGQLDHGGHPLLRWMAGNVDDPVRREPQLHAGQETVGGEDRRHRRRSHGSRGGNGRKRRDLGLRNARRSDPLGSGRWHCSTSFERHRAIRIRGPRFRVMAQAS